MIPLYTKKRKKQAQTEKKPLFLEKSGSNMNLSQRHIQHHHQRKAQCEAENTNVGMLAFAHFGNQLFHHHLPHGTGGKGQEIGQDRHNEAGLIQQ